MMLILPMLVKIREIIYLLTNNAIDNIYEYRPPINGERQGNFEPITRLVAPEKLQLLTYNSAYEINNNSEINLELATSKKDKNLFSSIDDSDNTGFASKVNYKSTNDILKSKIVTEIDINYMEDNFRSIESI
ncbi:MAG: hypothetical protein CM15mP36_16450 [Flavobacteriales bacterium]|nr:MAG: hypothetical protein CM15mP36_16450 [Flavobacteriales bacterium]